MRRITAAGLSALALCGAIATTAGTANADTTIGQGYADTSRQAGAPKPIGKKHWFEYSIPGSDVSGVWYWAIHRGKKERWLNYTIRKTEVDSERALVCFKMTGFKSTCDGTFGWNTFERWVGGGAKQHNSVKVAVGHWDPKSQTFVLTKSGPWHKLW